MKIIALSGPPRSGKTTMAQFGVHALAAYGYDSHVVHLACTLKIAAHALYSVLSRNPVLAWDHFEHSKDKANGYFLGQTPRQVYVDLHEKLIVPVLGQEFLCTNVRSQLQALAELETDAVFIPDVAGLHQVDPFVEDFGPCTIIRVSRSGTYWTDNRVPILDTTRHNVLDYKNENDFSSMDAWFKDNLNTILF